MTAVLPGLAVLSNYVRAVRYPDGVVINGTGNAETGFTTAAAAGPGDVIALFGTGFGATNPTVDPGLVFTGTYPTANPVTVTIGGVSAEVLWAGLSAAGLNQINVRIPSSLADGDHAVIATVSGSSTQSTALLKLSAGAAYKAQIFIGEFLAARFNGRHTNPRAFHPLLLRGTAKVEDIILLGLLGGERRAGALSSELHRNTACQAPGICAS